MTGRIGQTIVGLSVLIVLAAVVAAAVAWALMDTGPPGPAPYQPRYPMVTTTVEATR